MSSGGFNINIFLNVALHSPQPSDRRPQPPPPPRWLRWYRWSGSSWWWWGPPRPHSTPGFSPFPALCRPPRAQTSPGPWTGEALESVGEIKSVLVSEAFRRQLNLPMPTSPRNCWGPQLYSTPFWVYVNMITESSSHKAKASRWKVGFSKQQQQRTSFSM